MNYKIENEMVSEIDKDITKYQYLFPNTTIQNITQRLLSLGVHAMIDIAESLSYLVVEAKMKYSATPPTPKKGQDNESKRSIP